MPLPVPLLVTDHLVGRAVGGLAKAGDEPPDVLGFMSVAPIEDLAVEQGDRLAQPIRPDVIGQLPEGCGVHHRE